MSAHHRYFWSLPFERARQSPDVILALLVAGLVAALIFPLPAMLIDALLATNLTLSALILVAAILSERALSLSTFPTLLLLTTLFRLALNVSTTRLILSTGEAGDVVQTFGDLVVQGDVVIGLVLFLALTIVQLLVVGKGAERVAEVGARFTLDAMPGKQMTIDGALRAGAITEEDAQARRDDLNRESQFHGAMDGAMKFVKGDALAGLVITGINLVAGLAIGVLRFEMPIAAAFERFSVLSIGDALVAQIPSLLITLAAGVVTTRVAAKDEAGADLASALGAELFGNPKVLAIGAGLSLVLALVPGLPAIPFGLLALGLGFAAKRRMTVAQSAHLETSVQIAVEAEARGRQARAQRSTLDDMAPSVLPITIDVGVELSKALLLEKHLEDESDLVARYLNEIREALYLEMGVFFPPIRVRAADPHLDRFGFVIRLREIPVLSESIDSTRAMAIETPERLARLGVEARSIRHPLTGGPVSSVALADVATLRSAQVSVWSPDGTIALFVARILREHAKEFMGLQETSELVDRLEKAYPALVKEVVPKLVPLGQLADILRRLVDEGVSIRDLKGIFEALVQFAPHQSDNVLLTEHVRSALSAQLGFSHAGTSGRLSAVLLDPMIEDTLRAAITHTSGGSYLALEPEIRDSIIQAVTRGLEPMIARGVRPIILTAAEVRRYVHKLIEEEVPGVAVLSFQELPPRLIIQPQGRIGIEAGARLGM